MRYILSLSLSAIAASMSSVSAGSTIAILEFGPGGSIHRTTSSATESTSSAVLSLWNVLHRPSKRGYTSQHPGMSFVPDLFTKADAGIVIGLRGESLKSMSTAMSLLSASAPNVVGHIHVPEEGAVLMKGVESLPRENISRSLHLTAETAARGNLQGMATVSLAVDNDEIAAVADEQLVSMLNTLKKQAGASRKTVVLHIVVEEEGRRRLNEDEEREEEGENQNNNNDYSNGKTMYEIQTFNLFLWTAVGLVVLVSIVIGAFIDMPLMPDTLLFGETAKMAGSD